MRPKLATRISQLHFVASSKHSFKRISLVKASTDLTGSFATAFSRLGWIQGKWVLSLLSISAAARTSLDCSYTSNSSIMLCSFTVRSIPA